MDTFFKRKFGATEGAGLNLEDFLLVFAERAPRFAITELLTQKHYD